MFKPDEIGDTQGDGAGNSCTVFGFFLRDKFSKPYQGFNPTRPYNSLGSVL
jgi:hypothetical protein